MQIVQIGALTVTDNESTISSFVIWSKQIIHELSIIGQRNISMEWEDPPYKAQKYTPLAEKSPTKSLYKQNLDNL